MVKYCVASECPINEYACAYAAENGHSSASNTYAKKRKPLGLGNCLWAAKNGHLHILEYLVERKYDKYDEVACERAAENGH